MLPAWLRKPLVYSRSFEEIKKVTDDLRLNTVCQSALCPNIGECWSKRHLAFMILGNICTRRCSFCGVNSGRPSSDFTETDRILNAIQELNLNYIVITSVTRDDLNEGGADYFTAIINRINSRSTRRETEVLVPDFNGNKDAVNRIAEAEPQVFAHNIETIPRLYRRVRPQADYKRSLSILSIAKRRNPELIIKSGLFLGLGERTEEVVSVLRDLRSNGCDAITIGQYLSPTKNSIQIRRFLEPSEFDDYKRIAFSLGFSYVASGPFVRSSYKAEEVLCKRQID